jgi:uncharacterized protein YyaL (SSP411 family)
LFLQIVIVGAEQDSTAKAMLRSAHERFIPNKILLRIKGTEQFLPQHNPVLNEMKTSDQPAGYICENFNCTLPIQGSEEFQRALAPAQ